MGRVGSVAALALFVAACAPTTQERVNLYNDLGVQHYCKGEYDRARADFQAGLALVPNQFTLLYNIGQCEDHLSHNEEAEKIYRFCLQKQPNNADCRHALTALLIRENRTLEAQRMVEDWLMHEPKLSAAYAEDGWLYQLEHNPTKAIKRYQQAVYYDPHNTQALIEMGRIYEEDLNYADRALKLYQTALDYNPYQPELVKRINRLRARGIGPPHPDS